MTPGLLETKFHIPARRGSLVSRPRLLQALRNGLDDGRRMTLISAPAGYGKTTIATDWIGEFQAPTENRNVSVSWLSLDSADDEPARFLRYFLAAIQRADESLAEMALSLLDAPLLPPAPVLFDELLNRLSTRSTPLLLVLDDYQVISSRAIHDALGYLLENQTAGIHLIIITRQDPPLPLSRLRARGHLTELRAQDLRFTSKEAAQFFERAMRLSLTDEITNSLEERTEGWAVGLQLAGLALQTAADPDQFIRNFRGSHRYVLDFLAEEVIARQNGQTREFLSKTSVLDRFNAEVADALTGQANAQNMIACLEKANLFVTPLDDERVWYRYHHLFRDYLVTLLDKTEQATLYRKAAVWHEANNMPAEAVRYALAEGDTDFAVQVIERAISENAVWSGGNVALLASWLDAVPVRTLQNWPRLLLNASRIFYLASRFNLAEKRLSQAEETMRALPKTAETEQLLALTALYRGSLAGVYGDYRQAIEQTTFAQTKLTEGNYLAHARAYYNLGQAYDAAGQPDRAIENYQLSSEAARTAGVAFLAIQAGCAAAQVQIQCGEPGLAEGICREVVQSIAKERIPPLGLARIVLGQIALERNDLQAADELLQDGVALSRQGGLMDNVVTGMALQARLLVCKGDVAGALPVARDMLEITRTFGVAIMTAQAAAVMARTQLAAGDMAAARQWASNYQTNRDKFATEYEDLTLAHILLAADQPGRISPLIHPVLNKATEAGRRYACIEAMLLLSLAHRAKKEPVAAGDWLAQALALAAPRGLLRLFVDEGEQLSDLLPIARTIAPAFVDDITAAIASGGHRNITANALLSEPLSEQELRVLRLIIAGKSNREISEELVISVGTAKWHVHNVLQKFGVSNRPQAIARARELGF